MRWVIAITTVLLLASPAAAQDASPYAGVDTCKSCHADVWQAWKDTKHSTAFSRLGSSERQNESCVGCHVTDPDHAIPADETAEVSSDLDLTGVQCEACHGPSRSHAESEGRTPPKQASPSERTCTRCHNNLGPHYKGFYYRLMKGLVHPV